MESVPPELLLPSGEPEPDKLFADDGEDGYSKETIGDRVLYIKIYRVKKGGSVSSLIALFQPREMKKYADKFESFWPAKVCFPFNGGQIEEQMKEMKAAPEEIGRDGPIQRQLRHCGKAIFTGSEGKIYGLELSAPNEPGRVFEVQPAKNLKAQTTPRH
jgi:hypothetical protein